MSGLMIVASGTEPESLEHRHRGVHAEGAGDVAAGGDHTPVAAPDDYGDVAECRPVTFLDGCIECVAVEMRDSEIVQFTVPQETRGPAGRAGPGGGWPVTAIAANSLHGIILDLMRRAGAGTKQGRPWLTGSRCVRM